MAHGQPMMIMANEEKVAVNDTYHGFQWLVIVGNVMADADE